MNFTTKSPLAYDAAAARAMAYMIAQYDPDCPISPLSSSHLLNSVVPHFRWTIAAISEAGAPPQFGRYAACRPDNRCVGCASACSSESLVADIQRHTQSDVLLVTAGGGFDSPAWARVDIAVLGSQAISGVALPLVDNAGAVSLAMMEAGFSLRPNPHGLTVKKLWQPAATIDAQAREFCRRLQRLREAVISLNAYHFGEEFA
jgi:hypothetical protein